VVKEISPSLGKCGVDANNERLILLQDSTALSYVADYDAFETQLQALKDGYEEIEKETPKSPAATSTAPPLPGPSSSTPPSVSYAIPSPTDWITAVGGILANLKTQVTYTAATFQPTNDAFIADLDLALQGRAEIFSSTMPGNLSQAVDEIQHDFQSLYHERALSGNSLQKLEQGSSTGPSQQFTGLDGQLATFLSSLNTSDGSGGTLLTSVIKGKALRNSLGMEDSNANSYCSLTLVAGVAGGSTRQLNNWFLELFWHDPAPAFNGGAVFSYQLRDPSNRFLAGGTLRYLYGYTKWSAQKAGGPSNFQQNPAPAP
jgi:Merozoite surface antigen 2c